MLQQKELYDKILACWMGKNIGGTLGTPMEGVTNVLHYTALSDFKSDGPEPNDDLDLQLVNLHVMEQCGNYPLTEDFCREWAEHVHFPFDEYGFAVTNIRRGFAAPFSGNYNNPFIDCMGCPIRSELWAALSPGNPQRAIYFAEKDGAVDHAGGEGIYGEVFLAALESLAFESTDMEFLINESLKYIPERCKVHRVVSSVLDWYKSGVTYEFIRSMILASFGHPNFTDAPQNIGFSMVGLLYGNGFEEVLLKTLNLGYDTDSTCATVGSVYGIMYGTNGIPDDWKATVGDDINLSAQITGLDYPKTLAELTNRTIAVKNRLDSEDGSKFKSEDLCVDRQYYFLPDNSRVITVAVKLKDKVAVDRLGSNEISVYLKNNGIDSWDMGVRVDCAGGKKHIVLASGQEQELVFEMKSLNEKGGVAKSLLNIERYYQGEPWLTYKLKLVFPIKSGWKRDGETVYTDGNFIEVPAGKHKFETEIFMENKNTVKLIVASGAMLKAEIDGEVEIESGVKHNYMPAFHRCPIDQIKIITLDRGVHTITVYTRSDNPEMMAVLPVSAIPDTGCVDDFYLTDCILGLINVQ